ncbi:MAG: MarR family transcriptional regulator [Acidobacteria bacterium]|nr:MarR family transcriptional regulator [Acidobacteriota bacterium]
MAKQQSLEEMARELVRHFDVLAGRFLAPRGGGELSRSEAALLRLLTEGEASTMSDVSTALGLALSSSTGLVDRMVERQLVERSRPEADRRTVLVRLTPAGRKAHEQFVAERVTLGAGMLEPLPPSERETLLALFRKMSGEE